MMNINPSLEARVSAQERRHINLDARLEELSEETAANFKQLSTVLNAIDDQFSKIESNITLIVETQKTHTAQLTTLDTRLTNMETSLTNMDTRLTNMETLLTQILDRLPQ